MSTLKPVSAEKLTVKVLMRLPLSPETKAPPTGVMTGTAAEVKIPAAMSILYVPVLVLVTVTPCEANCGTICLGAPRLTETRPGRARRAALRAARSRSRTRVRPSVFGRHRGTLAQPVVMTPDSLERSRHHLGQAA